MNLKRSVCIFAISMVFCILIAGCIGTEEHNQTVPLTTASGYNQTPVLTPTPSLTQPVPNETYWIHLDPVGNKSVGDRVVITGKTNLNTGEQILININPADWDRKTRLQCEECSVPDSTGVTVFVVEGPQKNRSLFNGSFDSLHADCKGIAFRPQKYTAEAVAVRQEAKDRVNFTLMPSNISSSETYVARGCG
jgi:hypothetical protein